MSEKRCRWFLQGITHCSKRQGSAAGRDTGSGTLTAGRGLRTDGKASLSARAG